MHRRSAIKSFLVFSAGVTLIPSCLQDRSKSSLLLKNIKIDGDQEKLLAELAETIIPKTDTPGAKDVSAHLFALMMVDDCYSKKDQNKFVAGLNQFEGMTKKRFGNSFSTCTAEQRKELLWDIENKKEVQDDVVSFYLNMKRLTIQCFTTSKYFLTEIHIYKLIPGKFNGCIPVSKSQV